MTTSGPFVLTTVLTTTSDLAAVTALVKDMETGCECIRHVSYLLSCSCCHDI
jgi:hypothetical protein